MDCSKCGNECEVMSGSKGIGLSKTDILFKSVCCGARASMTMNKKENNMEWKDLGIGNLPSDFFVNDRYEVEVGYGNGYESPTYGTIEIIKRLIDDRAVFRYRLKPLEPIRIPLNVVMLLSDMTTDEIEAYCDNVKWGNGELLILDGRPVEIIEE